MAPLVRETLTLRVPAKLHRRLKAAAVDNGRSLNAEIVQRLVQSFEDKHLDPDRTDRS
jgi:predicted HicB family RNase H-like nuclease